MVNGLCGAPCHHLSCLDDGSSNINLSLSSCHSINVILLLNMMVGFDQTLWDLVGCFQSCLSSDTSQLKKKGNVAFVTPQIP